MTQASRPTEDDGDAAQREQLKGLLDWAKKLRQDLPEPDGLLDLTLTGPLHDLAELERARFDRAERDLAVAREHQEDEESLLAHENRVALARQRLGVTRQQAQATIPPEPSDHNCEEAVVTDPPKGERGA